MQNKQNARPSNDRTSTIYWDLSKKLRHAWLEA